MDKENNNTYDPYSLESILAEFGSGNYYSADETLSTDPVPDFSFEKNDAPAPSWRGEKQNDDELESLVISPNDPEPDIKQGDTRDFDKEPVFPVNDESEQPDVPESFDDSFMYSDHDDSEPKFDFDDAAEEAPDDEFEAENFTFSDSDESPADYAEDGDYTYKADDDDDDDFTPASKRSVKESVAAPIIAFIALIVMKVQQSRINFRGAPPEEAEDLGEEMAPDKAAKFYDKHIPWLKLRTKLSFLLCLVMAYISFGLPVPGALADTGVKAAVLLVMLLSVMLLGLDVFVSGLISLVKRRPHANSLVALSCLFSALDAVIIACGVKDFGLPYCAVSALAMAFTLLASVLNCRSSRISCRSAAALRNPFTLTAETSVSGEGITLLKSRCGTKDFVRRTEEYGPDEAAFGLLAPYLIIASFILSLIAAAVSGSFRGYAHILSGTFVFAAPFAVLFSFPLPFFVSAKMLIRKGAAIAGWSGLFDIGKSKHIIINDTDLFSKNAVSIQKTHILSGMKAEKVLSLAGTMISASGSALAPAFIDLMQKGSGSLLRMDEFTVHEGGGLVALINGEEILCGPAGFMQLMGIRLPKALSLKDCVFLSSSGVLCGFFEIGYTPADDVRDSLLTILRSDRHPIFALRDFNMTPQMLSRKFDIPTDGFDFPSFIERYEISAASPTEASKPAALISRDGLGPLISLADHSRRLYKTVNLCLMLCIMSVMLGMVLSFIYFCGGSFAAVGVGRVIAYMLLWLLPELILTVMFGRKRT